MRALTARAGIELFFLVFLNQNTKMNDFPLPKITN
jgi:hypothetical protein